MLVNILALLLIVPVIANVDFANRGPLGRHLLLFRLSEELEAEMRNQTERTTTQTPTQAPELDYYDAVKLEDEEKQKPKVVDGATEIAAEPVLSDPDYISIPALKVSQKDIEMKKFSSRFNFEAPQMMVEPADESRVVDGESGPPGISPHDHLSQPPVSARFTQTS
ncbi:hypothetical protein M3Y98_00107900 [Aphelenchoides besseyi]|nr:hypothetical protein M3Y98_00107900 [Aphelenchoides besseyi]KAI6194500.1 hypothetical protein M3Y96_01131600 [Aphelenchoides besseyi]